MLCSVLEVIASSHSVLCPHHDALSFSGRTGLTKQLSNGLLTLVSGENSTSWKYTPWPQFHDGVTGEIYCLF